MEAIYREWCVGTVKAHTQGHNSHKAIHKAKLALMAYDVTITDKDASDIIIGWIDGIDKHSPLCECQTCLQCLVW